MKIAVTGATGVLGRAAVRTLVADGHDVFGLARTPQQAELLTDLSCTPVRADIFDAASLATLFEGCDAVCSLASHIPLGYAALWPGAWRENDRLRTKGVATVLEAARRAGVRRVVQESVSFLYADNGDDWVHEDHPLGITRATEPPSVAEAQVQGFVGCARAGVSLRLGGVLGDDPLTRWMLRASSRRRPIGMGAPSAWAHVVHTDDLGPAVAAALVAPSGVYNVGADPVRREELVAGFAAAVGDRSRGFLGPVLTRLAGERAEPLTRSLRVSSEAFAGATGWTPSRAAFGPEWLEVAAAGEVLGAR